MHLNLLGGLPDMKRGKKELRAYKRSKRFIRLMPFLIDLFAVKN